MADLAPELIRITHDEYKAKYVGRTMDGRQFFLTWPFVPSGNEFLALYLFSPEGVLLEAKIDNFGPREHLDEDAYEAQLKARLDELGEVSFEDIEIAPFQLERFGTKFGLIPYAPEEEDEGEEWWVSVEPGDYMAFYPPWDGSYDT